MAGLLLMKASTKDQSTMRVEKLRRLRSAWFPVLSGVVAAFGQ